MTELPVGSIVSRPDDLDGDRNQCNRIKELPRMLRLSRSEVIDRVDELLEARYGSASLGNLEDPLDELVFILLSAQTGPNGYRRVFNNLKQRFPDWGLILEAGRDGLEEAIRPAGLSLQKARYLEGIVEQILEDARSRSGDPGARANLDFLKALDDEAVEAYLTSLPGVSVKTARCVMMYSLGRDVFPVDTHILRIMTRIGLAEPIHRKRAGDPLQELIPRPMRHRLHVNLIHHGRQLCQARAPKCLECPLVSFCETGLERFRLSDKPRPVAIDLFAGPGGLSSGFRREGYTIAFAADRERHAAQTYRHNHPGVPTFEADVASLKGEDILRVTGLRKGCVDVQMGGPPCQGYSIAGKRNPGHPDNRLYRQFARIGVELGAKLLIMENVPGVQNFGATKSFTFVQSIRRSFASRGLEARDFLLNSAEFGVPQRRRRIVFMAAPRKSPIASRLTPPRPTHVDAESRNFGLEPNEVVDCPVTVAEAFQGLPPRSPGEGQEVDSWNGSFLFNHVAMNHSDRVVDKIRTINVGEGAISYRRLGLDEPARTVIAGHRALPVHPTEDRTITVREAARLQSFEDDFRFLGPRAWQPLQLANAVPPLLSVALARHVKSLLPPSAE